MIVLSDSAKKRLAEFGLGDREERVARIHNIRSDSPVVSAMDIDEYKDELKGQRPSL